MILFIYIIRQRRPPTPMSRPTGLLPSPVKSLASYCTLSLVQQLLLQSIFVVLAISGEWYIALEKSLWYPFTRFSVFATREMRREPKNTCAIFRAVFECRSSFFAPNNPRKRLLRRLWTWFWLWFRNHPSCFVPDMYRSSYVNNMIKVPVNKTKWRVC